MQRMHSSQLGCRWLAAHDQHVGPLQQGSRSSSRFAEHCPCLLTGPADTAGFARLRRAGRACQRLPVRSKTAGERWQLPCTCPALVAAYRRFLKAREPAAGGAAEPSSAIEGEFSRGITVSFVLAPRLRLAHDQGCSGPESLAGTRTRSAFCACFRGRSSPGPSAQALVLALPKVQRRLAAQVQVTALV